MFNLKIRWSRNGEWWDQGKRTLEDLLSAIRRAHISEAKWGQFHMYATMMGGRRFYSLWIGGTMWQDEDLDELLPLIRENL